ncbi:MAG: TRC40/GET3/ArsA family transport-energizing ATPase [Acidobacteriota bacterium]
MRDLFGRRVLFFGGSNRAGKTTCAAAMALAASREGRRVLLVSTEPSHAHEACDLFGAPLSASAREVAPGLQAMWVDVERDASRFVASLRTQVASLVSPTVFREIAPGFDVVASMPGVADLAMCDRMADLILAPNSRADLIVFDIAPLGHALKFLQAPESLAAWTGATAARRRGLEGQQAWPPGTEVVPPARLDPLLEALDRRETRFRSLCDLLTGTTLASVVLVLAADRASIEHAARALTSLEAARIPVGGLVLNRVLPDGLYGDFYRARASQEQLYRADLTKRLGDRMRAVVPHLDFDIGRLADLERVSAILTAP